MNVIRPSAPASRSLRSVSPPAPELSTSSLTSTGPSSLASSRVRCSPRPRASTFRCSAGSPANSYDSAPHATTRPLHRASSPTAIRPGRTNAGGSNRYQLTAPRIPPRVGDGASNSVNSTDPSAPDTSLNACVGTDLDPT